MYSKNASTYHVPITTQIRAQWEKLVTEFSTGSENEREFCSRLDMKLITLRKWRYHFQSQHNASTNPKPARFVKINVPEERVSHLAAVLCIGPDIRLECPVTYDVSSLAQLALAVHHGR
ncbi:MAG: hypothetical protein ACI9XK_002021 [Granulosicoccus sp.]